MILYRCAIGLLLAIAAVTRLSSNAAADALVRPDLGQCTSTAQPLLPSRWRGIYLMAPFTRGQLMLADIVYDDALPAMAVKLYGLHSGSAQFLLQGDRTYMLGPSKLCQDLGDTGWRPLPRNLLGRGAHCEGSAPIGETAVNWWKVAGTPFPAANWIWFKTSDQSPFRLMFAHPSTELSVLSEYAFSYQLRFEVLEGTDLASIAAACQGAKPGSQGLGRAALRDSLAGMERSATAVSEQIREIAPGLDPACPDPPPPRWPDRFGMTTVMTPINANYPPLPAEVLYDWHVKSQRTRMYGLPKRQIEDALLIGARGYDIERQRDGRRVCRASQPGAVRPDWTQTAPCSCEAVLHAQSALAPYGTTQIMMCPMTKPRVLWTWYTLEGRPMVFMETAAPGDEKVGLLTLADYYAWVPDYAFPLEVFAKPPQCPSSPLSRAHAQQSTQCSYCHLDDTSGR